MTTLVEIILLVLAVLLLLPMTVLVAECLLALLPPRQTQPLDGPRPRTAVLIPAHDEEGGIGRTLASIVPQMLPADRVIVVADNCTDQTAVVARESGVMVSERVDSARRGKGYALDHGIRLLEQDPPAVVVLIDADTPVAEGAIDRLVREAAVGNRPVQAVYVLEVPAGGGIKSQLSAFAFQFKNRVRPLGLARLGLPCLLTGAGMAFPWQLIRDAPLASGNIVEDMKLGLDLAVAGHPPRLCPEARVGGELPSDSGAAVMQRTRWEHGHVQTLLGQVPRLLLAALKQKRFDLLGLALELSVPPLSLLFLLWVGLLSVAVGWWFYAGSSLLALLLLGGGLAVLGGLFAAWLKFGRQQLPVTALLAAPVYVLWKVPIYLRLVFRPQRDWLRTRRDVPSSPDGPPEKGPIS